jgi:hypothetical protein
MRTERTDSMSLHSPAAPASTEMSVGRATRRAVRRAVRRFRRAAGRRELLTLGAVLAVRVGAAAPTALATGTETSGYNQKPPPPTTTPEPKKEVEPTKEATKTTPAPTKSTEPTAAPAPKAATLPFTGLDLRWVVGAGLLLLAAGLSIRLALRSRGGAGG